ncbi:DUF6131 family protein [Mycobacterium sp. Dal123C01]|uniref:DUF6131 family protein n=1 Tax=Mycobacterium sp. Dal123C01 TaxID=3457577 RepID=UPI00403EA9CF
MRVKPGAPGAPCSVVIAETSHQAYVVLVLGAILFVVGLSLMLMGRTGHAVSGRRRYY